MSSVPIEEAQTRLVDLIDRLQPGDEVVITRGAKPVAKLTAATPTRASRRLGTMKGTVKYVAPDFDAPLDEFREYTG